MCKCVHHWEDDPSVKDGEHKQRPVTCDEVMEGLRGRVRALEIEAVAPSEVRGRGILGTSKGADIRGRGIL
jgi:hypothetical protein